MQKKKRVVKKQRDTRKITMSVPEETYYNIKQFAKEEIRTVSQQARFFLEIGLQVIIEQGQPSETEEEPPEKESAIGFHVDRSDDNDD